MQNYEKEFCGEIGYTQWSETAEYEGPTPSKIYYS
jgi:hypothetical protein